MKKDKIKVWIKRSAAAKPEIITIDNKLEALQQLVGGYIETLQLFTDMTFIVNEEGRLLGLPYNVSVGGIDLVGPVLMVGVDGDEFTDVPANALKMFHTFAYMDCGSCVHYDFKFRECEITGDDKSPKDICTDWEGD